jgi:exonuclease III
MKFLSYNCRGLASPPKKLVLKRLITHHQPSVILLQETMSLEASVTNSLESLFPSWKFIRIDATGRSGGLAVRWCKKSVKLQNSWALESCLGVDLFLEGLGLELRVLNVYGPYSEHATFWESLFKKDLLKVKNMILGGDLNLSFGNAEVWGPSA